MVERKDILYFQKWLREPGLLKTSTTSVCQGLSAPLGLLCCNTQNNQHSETMIVGATNRTEHEGKEERIKRKKAWGCGREGREDRAAGRAPETQTWLCFVPVSTETGLFWIFLNCLMTKLFYIIGGGI